MLIKVGLDIGGVLINRIANDGQDTDLRGEHFLSAKAVDGVFEAVKQLVETYGPKNVFIISKCGPLMEERTRIWLHATNFYTITGFLLENLYFCRQRHEKAPIAEMLGLTDFVDDRAEVLSYMRGIVEKLYLFGPQADPTQDTRGLIITENWRIALPLLLRQKPHHSL